MLSLSRQLAEILTADAALIGVGNIDCGDDGAGVRLAEALIAAGLPQVSVADIRPEREAFRHAEAGVSRIIFLDAADFGAAPGAAVLLGGDAIISRFPQVSTHKISLGAIALMLRQQFGAESWLLGIQPESLRQGNQLSPVVQTTLAALQTIILNTVSEVGGETRVPDEASAVTL